jgi:hypothetical protein
VTATKINPRRTKRSVLIVLTTKRRASGGVAELNPIYATDQDGD